MQEQARPVERRPLRPVKNDADGRGHECGHPRETNVQDAIVEERLVSYAERAADGRSLYRESEESDAAFTASAASSNP